MIKVKYNFNHISPNNQTDPRQTKINTKNTWYVCYGRKNTSSFSPVCRLQLIHNRCTMNDYELWSEAASYLQINKLGQVKFYKFKPAAISESYYNLNSNEFRKLCNVSNPASDGEKEIVLVWMQALRNKWRRTSKVWQYFDEVRENGEVLPKRKSCSN
jgi:hypothetical protein